MQHHHKINSETNHNTAHQHDHFLLLCLVIMPFNLTTGGGSVLQDYSQNTRFHSDQRVRGSLAAVQENTEVMLFEVSLLLLVM